MLKYIKWFTAPFRKQRIMRKILSRCERVPIYKSDGYKYLRSFAFKYASTFDTYTGKCTRCFGCMINLDKQCGFIRYSCLTIQRNGKVNNLTGGF